MKNLILTAKLKPYLIYKLDSQKKIIRAKDNEKGVRQVNELVAQEKKIIKKYSKDVSRSDSVVENQ